MVPVGVADQVVKDGCVDDVQQARARVVRGRFLHSVTIALIILPPAAREEPSSPSGNHPCTAAAATAALSHLPVHHESGAAQARQRRKSWTPVFHEKSKPCNIPAYGASCSFSSKTHKDHLPRENKVRGCFLATPQWLGYVTGRLQPCLASSTSQGTLQCSCSVSVSIALSCFHLAFQTSSSFFLFNANILIWLVMSHSAPRRRASQGSLSFTHSCLFPSHFLSEYLTFFTTDMISSFPLISPSPPTCNLITRMSSLNSPKLGF